MEPKLIPVIARDEIKIGPLYLYRACWICNSDHRFIAISEGPWELCEHPSGAGEACWNWAISGDVCGDPYDNWCFRGAVINNKLFRIEDGFDAGKHNFEIKHVEAVAAAYANSRIPKKASNKG